MGIILGPELPEVRGQVCLIHCCVAPRSEKLEVPAVDTDSQQANKSRYIK